MEASLPSQCSSLTKTKEEERDESIKKLERCYEKYRELILTLPKEKGWITENLYMYEGFWYDPMYGLEGTLFAKDHFQARPTDIFLISPPKCGTTWLKALSFAIVKRTYHTNCTNHPLLTMNPHECVPSLEFNFFDTPPSRVVENSPSPRLLATHIPYTSLPESILSSNCKIIYLCRNPKDVLVSAWYFMAKLRANHELPPLSLEEAFELFSKGISLYGPFWDHVQGYWKASQECPRKIFFVTYEEMKRDTLVTVKSLAEFLGQPFSLEEERKGVVEEIIDLCSFDGLRNLEVNKCGSFWKSVKNDGFFREGKVGNSKKHLTTHMIESLDKITNEKLQGIF